VNHCAFAVDDLDGLDAPTDLEFFTAAEYA
jgi:hypothetical protein